jgi:hypothetical protein
MEKSIMEIWQQVYPSLADCILLVLCASMFLWFRASIKSAIKQFTTTMNTNAVSVKEHLDAYNIAHEKSWTTLSDLVKELKIGKVWEGEYKSEIEHLKTMGKIRDDKIEKLDERLLCIERGRRNGDTK